MILLFDFYAKKDNLFENIRFKAFFQTKQYNKKEDGVYGSGPLQFQLKKRKTK